MVFHVMKQKMMTMFSQLPDEINNLINLYAANRLSHELCDDIQHKYIEKYLKKFDKDVVDEWLETRNINLHDYVSQNMTKPEMKHYFNIFDQCKCETRKRPTLHLISGKQTCCCKKYNDILKHCIQK